MNTIFTNEKLGRSIEDLRLHEIRQQVELQRMAQTVRTAWFKRMNRRISVTVALLKPVLSR